MKLFRDLWDNNHMSLELRTGENLSGKYVFFHANELKEGVEYALKTKVPQIQIREVLVGKIKML